MKRLNFILILMASLSPSLSFATTFTAAQECPYANRIKQLSGSNLPMLEKGMTYKALAYNKATKEYIRITIKGSGDKWTKASCGATDGDIVTPNAKRKSRNSVHKAGEFDYYKLALSYSPEFCLVKGDDQAQCSREWIVHGLWPQYNKGYPGNCQVASSKNDSINRKDIFEFMPSDYLIKHEWNKHGTCSGLSRSGYYALTEQLWDSLTLPDLSAGNFTPEQIRQAILVKNPALSANMIELACDEGSGPKNTLDEVRICYSKQGVAERCTEMERSCGKRIKVRELKNHPY